MGGPTGNAQDGTDATGVTPPAGADGIRGWLSGIYNRLSGTLTVALSSSSPLDVSDRSARLLGHVTVDNTISVGSDVTDRAARLLGHVTVDNTVAVTGTFFQPTQPVSGTFWQATQPVSGTVSVSGTVPVTGTFWQAIQPVSGTVAVSNFPATQPVSGTFWQATQPVSLATNTPDVTDRAARLLGHVTVDSAPTTAVTGTFWQATQPVSLPANQSVNNAQVNGSAVVTSVTGVQDVMPRKRTGTTGLAPNYTAFHITTSATTTITAATAYIQNVLIVVSGAGSAWTVKIQNKEATPKVLYPATTAALGTTQPLNLTEPVLATSGIDIITAGTTAGTVDVFVTYWQ